MALADYVDGVRINWRRLGLTIVGGTVLAYFEGLAATLLSLADLAVGLIGGFATWLGQGITVLLGFSVQRATVIWADAIPFVTGSGIFGYLVALAIVLLTLYIVAQVVSRVR